MNWTSTHPTTDNGHTDLGPAPALGSDGGGAPTKRAKRAAKSAWPEPLDSAHVRKIVAAEVTRRAGDIEATEPDVADLLGDVAVALREG